MNHNVHRAVVTMQTAGTLALAAACGDPTHPGIFARVGDDTLRAWIASVAPDAVKD
ncbi:MAG: hypothetical protein QOJ01_770 [Solirubrobacterales bacterium]|jgi:hypothetical protein|nr:hypothetical protein [Solirubrobacterales bacterium]